MPWTNEEKAKWRRRLRRLRTQFPIKGARIRRVPIKTMHGSAVVAGKKSNVYIDKDAPFSEATYHLYEEWAHILAGPENGHSPEWGRIYARIIRAMEKPDQEDRKGAA